MVVVFVLYSTYFKATLGSRNVRTVVVVVDMSFIAYKPS